MGDSSSDNSNTGDQIIVRDDLNMEVLPYIGKIIVSTELQAVMNGSAVVRLD